jgi:hypothetical protein
LVINKISQAAAAGSMDSFPENRRDEVPAEIGAMAIAWMDAL